MLAIATAHPAFDVNFVLDQRSKHTLLFELMPEGIDDVRLDSTTAKELLAAKADLSVRSASGVTGLDVLVRFTLHPCV